jgi:hypothetical protein
MRFLGRFGEWDQVVLGRNWMNDYVVRLMWGQEDIVPVTPQLLLITRTVDLPDQLGPDARIRFKGDTVAMSLTGVKEIVEWVDAGLPLPGGLRGEGAAQP